MPAFALILGFAPCALAVSTSYRYPVYNTDGEPASGIKEWKTGTADATAIASQTTWGTAGQDTWYVVNANKTISSRITCNGNVHLILTDGYTLTSSKGITVSGSNSLTVYAPTEEGTGILSVTGTSNGYAAIGGAGTVDTVDSGAITVNGGTVKATCGTSKYAAVIGGGCKFTTTTSFVGGTGSGITINGGKVVAFGRTVATTGARIGGGYGGEGRDIAINGGTVSVTNLTSVGAGIGGGQYGSGRDITVNGGTITVSRTGASGAGIGGGQYGIGQDIAINGGAVTVSQASGTSQGAGIGGGAYGIGRNIAVSAGTVEVSAAATRNGAGLGGGVNGDGQNIVIDGGSVTVSQTGGTGSGAGIGGGSAGAGRDITINGGTISVTQTTGSTTGAGIGGGYGGVGQGITINHGSVNVSFYQSNAAGIGGGYGSTGQGLDITINGGTVDVAFGTSTSSNGGAGIGGGSSGAGRNISINGGTVKTTGGRTGAGIGGGGGGVGENIAINGGTVTATGGYYGAGIGGAYSGAGRNITINGGDVTATAGSSSAHGIGSGTTATTAAPVGIHAADDVQVLAGPTTPPETNIAHTAETDLATNALFKMQYVTAKSRTHYAITTSTPSHGQLAVEASTSNALSMVTLTATPDAGYVLSSVSVCKTGDSATTVAVTRVCANVYQFTMPAFAVTAAATFVAEQQIATSLVPPAHATCKVYANGVLSSDGKVCFNAPATVVYTADDGYTFAGGKVLTHELDTSVSPAVDSTPPGDAVSGYAYRYAEYNEDGNPSSGIKAWKSAICTDAVHVPSNVVNASKTTSLSAGWYVVDSPTIIRGLVTYSGDVHLILADGQSLCAYKGITNIAARSLTIYGQEKGTGGLWAQTEKQLLGYTGVGGASIAIHNCLVTAKGGSNAAAIGGGSGTAVTNIVINGGTVVATGGASGAGIGGGNGGVVTNIVINGGTVVATGGASGAGIGGGNGGAVTNIIVNGGTVMVTGGSEGSGIGGGSGAAGSGITVKGGMVLAKGGGNAAGIGGGSGGAGSGIVIKGGMVSVTGGANGGAGIGGGNSEGGSAIEICGGTVTAAGGSNGAGVGGGGSGGGSAIVICGGTVTAAGGSDGAGVGGGRYGEGTGITFNGGTLTATGGSNGAGVGGGSVGEGSAITINGGTVTARGGSGGAGIGGGSGGMCTDITVTDGVVTAAGGARAAGIGCGNDGGASCDITIRGGIITATGGNDGAGIGGGSYGSATNIVVNGGTIMATGGSNGAGIGGGSYGSVTNIVIYGGTVTATGGAGDGNSGGAGIGSGFYGEGRYISIYGGMVTATGGAGGAGIGAGFYGNARDIFIIGRHVTAAAGMDLAFGIGSGYHGPASERIHTDSDAMVLADDTTPPETEIEHDSDTDLATIENFNKRYVTIDSSLHGINVQPPAHGTLTADPSAAEESVTVALKAIPEVGYAPRSVAVYKVDDPSTTLPVNRDGIVFSFTMPDYSVVAEAEFEYVGIQLITTSITAPEHSSYAVYVNGIRSDDGRVQLYGEATVVYTADEGYCFSNGFAVTNVLDTTVDPAVDPSPSEAPVMAYPITIEDVSGGAVSSSRSYGWAGLQVTLTVKPILLGYRISAYMTDDPTTPVELRSLDGSRLYEFTMPAGGVTVSATVDPIEVRYACAEYKTEDDPSSGLLGWKTNVCTEARVTVTETGEDDIVWNEGWYAVDTNLTANGRIVCKGDVHLILADGLTLTATKGISVTAGNALTIYGQDAGSGTLLVNPDARMDHYAGIGGDTTVATRDSGDITIHGGTLTTTGGVYGAGIGGGVSGASGRIVINGGTVTAIGREGSAGIGGGNAGVGQNIVINGGTVWASGTSTNALNLGGSGIGGGSLAMGRNILINGGTVTATGYQGMKSYAAGAGIGGGQNGEGQDIRINGGTVTAKGGSSSANGIGSGERRGYSKFSARTMPSARIYAATGVKVLAGSSSPPTAEISHNGETDLAEIDSFRRVYVAMEACSNTVSVSAAEHGTLSAAPTNAFEFTTVSLTATPDAGFARSALVVCKSDSPSTTVPVTWTNATCGLFSMPGFDVTVSATFVKTEPIASAVTAPAHATCQIFTNGVLSADGTVWSNLQATVVYTADDGYAFAGGTVITNVLDTTVSPAVDPAPPAAAQTAYSITVADGTLVCADWTRAIPGAMVLLRVTSSTSGYRPVVSPTGPSLASAALPKLAAASPVEVRNLGEGLYEFTMPSGGVTVSATVDPLRYVCAEYKTDGDPSSGIRAWKTNSCSVAASVTGSSGTNDVIWNAGWYAVDSNVTNASRIVCRGDVHLILVDGCTLTASLGITVAGGNSLTVYGQDENTGTLQALQGSQPSYRAGIGGDTVADAQDSGAVTIHGGTVTAQGGMYAAGIGGGSGGAGRNLTVNGGTVSATGLEGGAGIGGGTCGAGLNIAVNGGCVTARGGVVYGRVEGGGAGIGGGSGGMGRNITLNGGTVTTTGATRGAGIGGGYGGTASDISICGGSVTATAGSAGAYGIGSGVKGETPVRIRATIDVQVLADATTPPATQIPHNGATDLAEITDFTNQYVKADVVSPALLPTEPIASAVMAPDHATFQIYTNGFLSTDGTVWSNQLATVVYAADAGYAFTNGTRSVTNVLETTVSPAADPVAGDVKAESTARAITVSSAEHGQLTADRTVTTADETVTLTATPEDGYVLSTVTVSKTGTSETNVPVKWVSATVRTFTMPDHDVTVTTTFAVEEAHDELTLGDFNFSMMTFPRATGSSLSRYRRLTVMLSSEMTDESLALPSVAGYTVNTELGTDYSYVIDIDDPGKTPAEIATEYIRGIAFNGCRNQQVRFILESERTGYKTFYYEPTGHYYQYVPYTNERYQYWWAYDPSMSAYDLAQEKSYLGRKGYLATVTSAGEDVFIYKASAGVVGWLGGTAMTPTSRSGQCFSGFLNRPLTNRWYWACGPECGTVFFDAHPNLYYDKSPYNPAYVVNRAAGRYFNWNYASKGEDAEPNCTSGTESCLTTLAFGAGAANQGALQSLYSWNDIDYSGGTGLYAAQGYVVEYGDQTVGDTLGDTPVAGYVVSAFLIHAPVVTFDAGAGAFADGEATNAVTQLNAADGYVLPSTVPTRADWHFTGWYTNLADKSTAVMAGTPLYMRADHTVYALWAEGGYTNVTVKTDDGDDIDVDLPEEDLKKRGGDPNAIEENGNKVWENIVAGLDPDAYVWTNARQNDDEKRLAVVAEGVGATPVDTGLTVTYYLDRVSRDGLTRFETESQSASRNALSVNLAHVVSNAYYKARLVISKDDSPIKELVSTNTLGILKQVQAVTNAVVATPWGRLSPYADEPVTVANFVKTANLAEGDELRFYPEGALTAQIWTLSRDLTWTSSVDTATNATVARGCGVWLCRTEDRCAQPYYLFGQLNDDISKTAAVEGINLLGATGVDDFAPVDHVASAKEGDWLLVPGVNVAPIICQYTNSTWRHFNTAYVTTNIVQSGASVPVSAYHNTLTTDAAMIPPGTGYWFGNRTGVAAAATADGTRLLYFQASAVTSSGDKLFDYAKVGVAKDGDATWSGTGKRYLKIRASNDATTNVVVQLSDGGERRQATGWAEIPAEYAGSECTFYLETYVCDSDGPVMTSALTGDETSAVLATEHHIYDPASTDPQEVTPWTVDVIPALYDVAVGTNLCGTAAAYTNGLVATSRAQVWDVVTVKAVPGENHQFLEWTGNAAFADATQATTTFTMGPSNVAVTANFFRPDVTYTPEDVSNAKAKVYTNGVELAESTSYAIPSNMTAYVVYTVNDGYYFSNSVTAITNAITTSTDPSTAKQQYAPKRPIANVTITAQAITNVYTGVEQKNDGFDWTVDSTYFTTDDFAFAGISNLVQTSVGTTNMNLKADDFAFTGDDRFWGANFTVVQDGILTVTQRCVTVTSGSKTDFTYDGKPHAYTNLTVTAGSFASGEGISTSNWATVTYVGAVSNAFDYAGASGTSLSNYAITVVTGEIAVVAADIGTDDDEPGEGTVPAGGTSIYDVTAMYDGAGHTIDTNALTAITLTASTPEFTYALTKDGAYQDTPFVFTNVVATSFWYKVSATNYNDYAHEAKITVTNRPVTLASQAKTWVFDGDWHSNAVATCVSAYDFVAGETVTTNFFAKIREVGSISNDFTVIWNGTAKESNYALTLVTNALTVTALESVTVTITGHVSTVVYDGTKHTVSGYGVKDISSELYTTNDFKFTGLASTNGTDVGTYAMGLLPAQFANTNANFSGVTFVIETDGGLEITKATPGTTGGKVDPTDPDPADPTKPFSSFDFVGVYDGAAHTIDTNALANLAYQPDPRGALAFSYALSSNGVYQTAPFDFTDVVTTSFWYKIVAPNFTDYIHEAKVTVTNRPVTLASQAKTWTFDGDWHSNAVAQLVSPLDFVAGETVTTNFFAKIREVGSVSNDFTVVWNGTAKEPNYTLTLVTNALTVTALEGVTVTITGQVSKVVYDGTKHTVSGYGVKDISSELYTTNDFKFTGLASTNGTDVGTYAMGLLPAQFANTNANFSGVTFVIETDGGLEITKATPGTAGGKVDPTDPDPADPTKPFSSFDFVGVYDGAAHTIDTNALANLAYQPDPRGALAFSYALSSNGVYQAVPFDFTDVVTTSFWYKIVTPNFTDYIHEAKVTITNRPVTLASQAKTWVFDGDWHSNAVATCISAYDFVVGETVTTNFFAKIREVGGVSNDFTVAWNGTAKESNYTLTLVTNTLTVTAADAVTVTITAQAVTNVYTGFEQRNDGFVWTASSPLFTADDFTFSGTSNLASAAVCDQKMNLKPSDFAYVGGHFAGVSFVIAQDGILAITQRCVTVTSGSKTDFVYDGQPHAFTNLTVTAGSFAADDDLTSSNWATVTYVGAVSNAFDYAGFGGTSLANYAITVVTGEIAVVAADIGGPGGTEPGPGETPAGQTSKFDVTAMYDGEGHTIDTNALAGITLTASTPEFTYSLTKDGAYQSAPFVFTNVVATSFWYKVSATNYNDYAHEAKVTITNRPVVVTSADKNKRWDGTPLKLTAEDVTETFAGTDGGAADVRALPEGESFVYGDLAERTDVGSSPASFSIAAGANTRLSNYAITCVTGTLTVAWGQFTITYNALGGAWADDVATTNIDACEDTGYELPSDPSRDGYTLIGWFESYTNGSARVEEGGALQHRFSHTIYAKWESTTIPPEKGEAVLKSDDASSGDPLEIAITGAKTSVTDAEGAFVVPDRISNGPNNRYVTEISQGAFAAANYRIGAIRSLTTPLYLVKIGAGAFYQQRDLKSLAIAPSVDYRDPSKLVNLVIERQAFAGSALESVLIPSNVTTVADNAFLNCTNLSKVVFLGDGANLSLGAKAIARCGGSSVNGIRVYVSPAFLLNHPGLEAALVAQNPTAKIQVTTSSPALSAQVGGLRVGEAVALVVRTNVEVPGTLPDVSTVRVSHSASPEGPFVELSAGITKTPFTDGTVLVEFEKPAGDAAYWKVEIAE